MYLKPNEIDILLKDIKKINPDCELIFSLSRQNLISKIAMLITLNFSAHKKTSSSYREQLDQFRDKTIIIKEKLRIFGITDIFYCKFKWQKKQLSFSFPGYNFNKLYFSFNFFWEITTFYHDNLDSLAVYNHIIGKIYKEGFNFDLIKIFLSGELDFYYFRHIFKPFVILYSIFNTELAFWITDFLFKATCYFTFFCLAKKIQKNNFIAFLGSTLFACITPFKTLGFGLAFFPYLLYLIFYRTKLNTKHYLLLIFFGLNTDITTDLFFIPYALLIIFFIDKKLILKISKL